MGFLFIKAELFENFGLILSCTTHLPQTFQILFEWQPIWLQVWTHCNLPYLDGNQPSTVWGMWAGFVWVQEFTYQ